VDIKQQLLQLDQKIQDVQEKIQSYRASQWRWMVRVVYLCVVAELAYFVYWKFFLPPRIVPLANTLYLAVFALIPLWYDDCLQITLDGFAIY